MPANFNFGTNQAFLDQEIRRKQAAAASPPPMPPPEPGFTWTKSPEETRALVGDLGKRVGQTAQVVGNFQPTDADTLRQMRRDFATEYAASQTPRGVPQVGAAQATGANLGPAAQSAGVTLAPNERAQAALAMAQQADGVGPTERVNLGPAQQAGVGVMDAAGIDRRVTEQARGVQDEAIGSIRGVLSGAAPSVAERQQADALNRNINTQQGIAAGARGLSAASARRQAARNIARLNADAATQGALVRAQEQATARGQLGGLATDVRGQDIGIATTEAGLKQDAAKTNVTEANATSRFNAGQGNTMAVSQGQLTQGAIQGDADRQQGVNNLNAQLGTQVSQGNADRVTGVSTANAGATNARNLAQGQLTQNNNQFNTGATNQRTETQGQLTQQNNQFNTGQTNTVGTQNADRTLQGRQLDDQRSSSLRGDVLGAGKAAADTNISQQQVDVNRQAAKDANTNKKWEMGANFAVSAATAAPALLALSDERQKTGIKSGDADVEAFLREVKPMSFEFKGSAAGKPGVGPGRHLGVMAQDVEDSPLGDDVVIDGPAGKALDQGNMMGPLLAAIAHVNRKVDDVAARRREAAREMR